MFHVTLASFVSNFMPAVFLGVGVWSGETGGNATIMDFLLRRGRAPFSLPLCF